MEIRYINKSPWLVIGGLEYPLVSLNAYYETSDGHSDGINMFVAEYIYVNGIPDANGEYPHFTIRIGGDEL